jgi:recombinational DNA repair protein RecR
MAEEMTCPADGAQMNHQASKLVYPTSREEAEQMTEAMDGVIEEVYACPVCGRIDSKRGS